MCLYFIKECILGSRVRKSGVEGGNNKRNKQNVYYLVGYLELSMIDCLVLYGFFLKYSKFFFYISLFC